MTCHDEYSTTNVIDRSTANRIVVGVDGSDASQAALRWASRQAELAGAQLEAVNVYEATPPFGFATGGYPAVIPVDPAELRQSARDVLRETVVRSSTSPGSVRMVTVADQAPAKALLRMAIGASMLVVGAHRHHGLGVLLGSTATSCVRQAGCPVVVVPADWTG